MIRRLFALALIMGTVVGIIPQRLSAAGPWYVAPSGSDSNDCLSWAAACRTIERALILAGAGDYIYIAAGTYAENVLFVASENLVGSGAGVTTIDAGGTHQVMFVSGVANLSGLTLRNGQASDGGGIYNSGTLTITASLLTNNIATSSGGGISNSGRLVLQNSLVSGNEVSATVGFGGGIGNDGSLTIENSTIQGNTSPYVGGLYNSSFGTAEIANSTFNGNDATVGYTGALHNTGAITVTNSTVSGNTASTSGGGVGNAGTGTLTLLNNTIVSNTAGSGGGGLHTFNSGVTAKNTIFAYNLPANCGLGGGASVTSLGYNLDSGSSCGLVGTGDLSNVGPMLGPLQYNGGATVTHALLPGSPAIDAGTNSGCPATDQRGFSRPRGATCDIGAFEWFDLVQLFLPLILK